MTVLSGEDASRDQTACETTFNASVLTEMKIDPFLYKINLLVKNKSKTDFFLCKYFRDNDIITCAEEDRTNDKLLTFKSISVAYLTSNAIL